MPYIPILFLVFSNAIPLWGVLFNHWNASSILYLYWFETVVIGVFGIIKIALAQPQPSSEMIAPRQKPESKITLIPFFMLHFGSFITVEGIILFSVIAKDFHFDQSLMAAILSQILGHGVSFVIHFIGEKDWHLGSSAIPGHHSAEASVTSVAGIVT